MDVVLLITTDGDKEVVGPFPDSDHSMEWVDRVQPQMPKGTQFHMTQMLAPFDPADLIEDVQASTP